MREPPESHKQRFYKLPQVSWSWVATLIVYWGDFSSEGYYLHIRNSYTFNSSWWISCVCLLLPWAIFARNPLTKSTTCGCETSMLVVCQVTICLQLEELATNYFPLVEKCIRCSFKLNTGCPVLFLSNRRNIFFSDVLVRMWIQMFECQNLLRQCVSVGPYICWNMLKYASIIF